MEATLYLLGALLLYLLPYVIARWRRHRSIQAIAAVNLLFGWTILGWLWAFIWALTGNTEPQQVIP